MFAPRGGLESVANFATQRCENRVFIGWQIWYPVFIRADQICHSPQRWRCPENNLQMQMFIPPQVRFPQGGNGRFQIFTKPRAGWILRVISAVSFSLVPRGPLHDSAFVPVITFAHLSWITVAHRKDFFFLHLAAEGGCFWPGLGHKIIYSLLGLGKGKTEALITSRF